MDDSRRDYVRRHLAPWADPGDGYLGVEPIVHSSGPNQPQEVDRRGEAASGRNAANQWWLRGKTDRTVRTAALGLIRADPSPRASNERAQCLARTRVLVPSRRPSCGQIDFFSDAGRQATGPSSRVLAEAMTSAEVVDLTPPSESGDNT